MHVTMTLYVFNRQRLGHRALNITHIKVNFFHHLKMRLGFTKSMRVKAVLRSGKQLQRYLEMDLDIHAGT